MVGKHKVQKNISVVEPFLAPLDEYVGFLEKVWSSKILTHNGPMVRALEIEIQKELGLDRFVAVSNGTTALQIAIKALNLSGEIITPGFSWIATASAIKWEGCSPVFCDIHPETLNIDVEQIESCINKNTVAIMPVHVFGNPCDVESIEEIAAKHKLKVIYDAAHAFGTTVSGKSVLTYGDISATSLHATKMLNTGEGGGCVSTDQNIQSRLEKIRFFGFDDSKNIAVDGLNGKMNELSAALGLANIKYISKILSDRQKKYKLYRELLGENTAFTMQKIDEVSTNFSYFPLIFETKDVSEKIFWRFPDQKYFEISRQKYSIYNTFQTKII